MWAEAQPEKHWELFDGVPELQQPQNWGHARHILQVVRVLDIALKSPGLGYFRLGTQGLVVKAGLRTAFEPDIVIFSGSMSDYDIIMPDPLIVIEVFSPSTAGKDLTMKLAGYFNVPTIQHYVIVDWEEKQVIHHRRQGGGLAKPEILSEGELHLDPPGLTFPLCDMFSDE